MAAPSLDLGHDQPVPAPPGSLFGPARFTPAEQAAHPTLPLTRIIKDVLHVGTIRVEDEANGGAQVDWTITPPLLAALAESHALARRRGYATVIGYTHGDRLTRLIDPRDQIAPVDQLLSDGRVLWASFYVRPEVADELSNLAYKTSPYILAGYRDTGGQLYPAKVMHIAITDNPRLPGQGPFHIAPFQAAAFQTAPFRIAPFRIALCDPVSRQEVPMSWKNAPAHNPLFAVALADEADPPADTPLTQPAPTEPELTESGPPKPEPPESEPAVTDDSPPASDPPAGIAADDVDTLLGQVGRLLQTTFGLSLPADTDGSNLVERLSLILDMAAQIAAAETDGANTTDPVSSDEPFIAVPFSQSATQSATPAPAQSPGKQSPGKQPAGKPSPRVRLALRRAEQRGEQKARFEYALADAGRNGTPADLIQARRILGSKYGYDLSLLADLPHSVPMGNPLGSQINGSAPSVSRTPGRPDTDRITSTVNRLVKRGRMS